MSTEDNATTADTQWQPDRTDDYFTTTGVSLAPDDNYVVAGNDAYEPGTDNSWDVGAGDAGGYIPDETLFAADYWNTPAPIVAGGTGADNYGGIGSGGGYDNLLNYNGTAYTLLNNNEDVNFTNVGEFFNNGGTLLSKDANGKTIVFNSESDNYDTLNSILTSDAPERAPLYAPAGTFGKGAGGGNSSLTDEMKLWMAKQEYLDGRDDSIMKYIAAPLASVAGILANIWLTQESWKRQEAEAEKNRDFQKDMAQYKQTGTWRGEAAPAAGGGGGEAAAPPTLVALPGRPAGR